MNAGEVDAIEQAVEDPQPALHLPDSEGLGPCRLLDLPVELLLQILELLWEPARSTRANTHIRYHLFVC
jgi:hypothetical protein